MLYHSATKAAWRSTGGRSSPRCGFVHWLCQFIVAVGMCRLASLHATGYQSHMHYSGQSPCVTHRLHMPSLSQTQPTSYKRWSLEWAALTGTQLCAVFSFKDFCALGMPESVGMNGQIDWQALQISHLVCKLAGQRCSEAWGTFWTWTGQSITALVAWRKEEWRKEAADISPFDVGNDLGSTRLTLALFRGQPWETAERRGGAHMGISECCNVILSWDRNGYDVLAELAFYSLVLAVFYGWKRNNI